MSDDGVNWCFCHTCQRPIQSLGIMNHRKAHRVRKQNCTITFSTGKTYAYYFSDDTAPQTSTHKDG